MELMTCCHEFRNQKWVHLQKIFNFFITPVVGYPMPGTGVPPGQEWGIPPWSGLGYPPDQDWGTAQKGSGTRDQGKNLGLGYPQKGPGTRDLGKNLGLGTPRKDMGPETWERTWDWGTPHVDRQTDACENIAFPSYYVRGGKNWNASFVLNKNG